MSYEVVQGGRRHLALRRAGINGAWEARHRVMSPLRLTLIAAALWVLLGLWEYRGQRWGERNEPYTLPETFYVMAQIVTTVGYGDYCPVHESGFLFTALYVLTAAIVFSGVGTAVTDSIIKSQNRIMTMALSELSFAPCSDTPGDSAALASLDDLHGSIFRSFVRLLSPGVSALMQAFTAWMLFVIIGILFFCTFPGEEKTFAEAFYMSVLTLTTVGFGDKTPSTEGGRVFATVWMILGTMAFANMVAKFSAVILSRSQLRRLDEGDLNDIVDDELFKKCHPDESDSNISRADFILFMMKDIGVLDLQMVEQLSANFDELDTNLAGQLSSARIGNYTRRRRGVPQLGQITVPVLPRFHTIS